MTLSQARPTDLDRLFAVADLLIPVGQGMPSASQADPNGTWTKHVLGIRPDLVAPLERALAKTSGATTFVEVDKALVDDPDAFAALTLVVAGAYYLNPDIRRQVGYPGQVAQPPTGWSFGTESLVERVVARGRKYRPTPGDSMKGGS